MKDIQDSLMEVKLLNQPLEEELSSFLAKVEKQQRFHGYGHLRTCGGSVDKDEKVNGFQSNGLSLNVCCIGRKIQYSKANFPRGN